MAYDQFDETIFYEMIDKAVDQLKSGGYPDVAQAAALTALALAMKKLADRGI